MAWSDGFNETIRLRNRARLPRYVVESIDAPGFNNLGGVLRLSSHDQGPYYRRVIAATGHSITPGVVTPGEWSTVSSQARIAVTSRSDFRGQIRRGQLAQIRMGFSGWSLSDFQPVFIGHIQDVPQAGPNGWAIDLRGITSSFSTRFNDDSSFDQYLFRNFPNTTTLAANYTAGAATVQVSSVVGIERETGGNYIFAITPTGGSTFYLTATGTAVGPLRYTGVSATAILGTTAVNATSGDAVAHGYMVNDSPTDIIRKLLVSYNGDNGPYDTLPESWGIGMPSAFIDHNDIDNIEAAINPGGGSGWHYAGFTSNSDVMSVLQAIMQPAGLYFTERQGNLTIRWGSALRDTELSRRVINERDIVALESYNSYSPQHPVEYRSVRSFTSSAIPSSLVEEITSRPILSNYDITLPYISDNQSAWRDFINTNLGPWKTRIPEVVSLTLTGWAFAGLCPGSYVVINCRDLMPRDRTANAEWYVLSCQPDWFGSTTKLIAAKVPTNETDR